MCIDCSGLGSFLSGTCLSFPLASLYDLCSIPLYLPGFGECIQYHNEEPWEVQQYWSGCLSYRQISQTRIPHNPLSKAHILM